MLVYNRCSCKWYTEFYQWSISISRTILSVKVGFGLQKENEDLLAKLSEFLKSNPDLFTDLKKQWNSIKLDSEYLDTILESTACTLNVIAKKRS